MKPGFQCFEFDFIAAQEEGTFPVLERKHSLKRNNNEAAGTGATGAARG